MFWFLFVYILLFVVPDSYSMKAEQVCGSSPRSLGKNLITICRSSNLHGPAGIYILKTYLANIPDLSLCDRQGSALMWLAYFGYTDLILLLNAGGASFETVSDLGYTALHAAAQNGHLEVVKALVERNVDKNRQAACGSTPLHLATQGGHREVVCYLLEEGVDMNLQDSLGRTALHLVAWTGDMQGCKALIAAGADVNVKAIGGLTPLHVAAYKDRAGVLTTLIRGKADTSILNDENLCVRQYAIKCGKSEMVSYIEYVLMHLVTLLI